MIKVKPFPFFINYMDIDQYLFWMVDKYGENAEWISKFDQTDFQQRIDNPVKYKINADELLLSIRQFLVDSGYEKEVKACDKEFSDKRKNRGKENPYVPISERWKNERPY